MATVRKRLRMQADAAFAAVQERAAHFARQMGPHAEKRLMRDLDIEEWTAERVLMRRASWPVIAKMLKAYGWRCAAFVLEPVCGQVDRLELAHKIEANRRLAEEALRENDELRRTLAATVGVGVDLAGQQGPSPGGVADRAGRETAGPVAVRRERA